MSVSALGLPEHSFHAGDLEVCQIRRLSDKMMRDDIERMLNITNSGHGFEALPIPNRSIAVIVDGVGRISGRPVNQFCSHLLQFQVFGDVLIMKQDEEGEPVDMVTDEQPLQYWQEDGCRKLIEIMKAH